MAVAARLPVFVLRHHHARAALGAETVCSIKPAAFDGVVLVDFVAGVFAFCCRFGC